jgi:protein gp37
VPGHPYEQGFDVKLWPNRLVLPSSWKAARMIFVNSMSDLFHAQVPDEFITRIFETMNDTPRHTFQLLTKRPERAADLAPRLRWTPNIWMGVTVERQPYASRLAWLRRIPATIRFVSCEPLLGPVELSTDLLDWVIAGGESGPRSRRMHPDWARSLRDQCVTRGIPFFFKQWGSCDENGRNVGKSKAGKMLDGRIWNGLPRMDQH